MHGTEFLHFFFNRMLARPEKSLVSNFRAFVTVYLVSAQGLAFTVRLKFFPVPYWFFLLGEIQ